MDLKAITEYAKSRKFQTLIGEVDLSSQRLQWLWTVGQWQNGFFHGVAGVNVDPKDAKPVVLKTGW